MENLTSIQLKEEKQKFDPKTLQPFDKVLVRCSNNEEWRCCLFSHIDKKEAKPFVCVFGFWTYCIPYNEETKHLVGTTEDAPEYYEIWKK